MKLEASALRADHGSLLFYFSLTWGNAGCSDPGSRWKSTEIHVTSVVHFVFCIFEKNHIVWINAQMLNTGFKKKKK